MHLASFCIRTCELYQKERWGCRGGTSGGQNTPARGIPKISLLTRQEVFEGHRPKPVSTNTFTVKFQCSTDFQGAVSGLFTSGHICITSSLLCIWLWYTSLAHKALLTLTSSHLLTQRFCLELARAPRDLETAVVCVLRDSWVQSCTLSALRKRILEQKAVSNLLLQQGSCSVFRELSRFSQR